MEINPAHASQLTQVLRQRFRRKVTDKVLVVVTSGSWDDSMRWNNRTARTERFSYGSAIPYLVASFVATVFILSMRLRIVIALADRG